MPDGTERGTRRLGPRAPSRPPARGRRRLAARRGGGAGDLATRPSSMALAYTTLEPASPVPEVEVVSREEWIGSNLAELAKLLTPARGAASPPSFACPGRSGPSRARRSALPRAPRPAQLSGTRAKRVLGQYQVSLRPDPGEPRMLLVGANLPEAAAKARRRSRGVPPVGPRPRADPLDPVRLGSLAARAPGRACLRAPRIGFERDRHRSDHRRAQGLVTPDPRAGLRRILDGELTRIFAGEEQGEVMDRMAAVMAVDRGLRRARDGRGLGRMCPSSQSCASGWTPAGRSATGLADMIARFLGMGAEAPPVRAREALVRRRRRRGRHRGPRPRLGEPGSPPVARRARRRPGLDQPRPHARRRLAPGAWHQASFTAFSRLSCNSWHGAE